MVIRSSESKCLIIVYQISKGVKTMFEEYLEKELQRKVKIICLLWENEEMTSTELSCELGVTSTTVKSDIKAINADYCSKANPLIISDITGYSILNKSVRNKKNYLKKIYQTSLFVKATVFFLKSNFSKIKELEIKEYLSQTKTYNLKSDVGEYLERLKVIQNGKITEKTELRKRFLLAFYQWELGMEVVEISNTNKQLYQSFFEDVEAIENCVLSTRSKEYATILFQIGFLRRKVNPIIFREDEISFIKKNIVYQRLKHIIKKFLQKMLHFEIKESDIIYMFIVFNAMNANYYDDNSKTFYTYLQLIKENAFLKYDYLMRTFEKEFTLSLENNLIYDAAVVTFMRKCLFNLQALIPEEHISIGNAVKLPKNFNFRVQEVLEDWNITTGLELVFSEVHIRQLSSKLIFLLRKKKRIRRVYLLTSFHTDYLLAREVLTNEYGALVEIRRFNPIKFSEYHQEDLVLYDTDYDDIGNIICKKLKIKYIFDLNELQNIRALLFEYNLEDIEEDNEVTKTV